jgi:non-ribosomal peptide synthetase component F
MPSLELSGVTLSLEEVENQTARFDLALDMWEESGGIRGIFEYNQDLFDQSTVCRMAGHLQTMLESAIANPNQPISTLPLLTPPEQQQLLVEWNNTQANYTSDRCLHELFEVQAEKNPDAVAVVFPDQQLTYREVNQQANKIANYLRKLGVGAEVPVGICVDRSLEMIVGLLGILKAGGAYVPLDPVHPRDRLISIVEDARD